MNFFNRAAEKESKSDPTPRLRFVPYSASHGSQANNSRDAKKFKRLMAIVFCVGLSSAIAGRWFEQSREMARMASEAPENSYRAPVTTGRDLALNLLVEVLVKAGDALMIASVLAFVVDSAAKVRLLKEFGEGISLHIMGRSLPPELRDHIGQYLEARLVRRNWQITYTIEPWPTSSSGNSTRGFGDEHIKLTTLSQYQMENCTKEPQDYEIRFRVSTSAYPEVGNSEIVRVGFMDPATGKFTDYRHELLNKQIYSKSNGQLFKVVVSIPPCSPDHVKAKEWHTFISESTECYSAKYVENFTAKYPVIETTFTAYYDKEAIEVDFYLSFADSEAYEMTPIENGQRWFIKRPMLPGQSFFTTWRPKSARPVCSSEISQEEVSSEQDGEAISKPALTKSATAGAALASESGTLSKENLKS